VDATGIKFYKNSLNQVTELERQYDIKIKVDAVDTSKLFTGSFTHTNQKIALEAVTIPLKLSYKRWQLSYSITMNKWTLYLLLFITTIGQANSNQ
jgi:hypothetical protein